ncbi:MAG: hypothetical protein JSV58_04545, partial [Candidatus Bathyarchaeota archaeon]
IFDMSIPNDVDPGLVFSKTSCVWKVQRQTIWQEQLIEGAFRVTYLRNKPYEDLQIAYAELLADYDESIANYSSLLSNYQQLLSDYNQLQSNHNNLQVSFDTLNSTYNSLISEYSSIQASLNGVRAKYEFGGQTANALDLMYLFIETTVIFIATTAYFVFRKRRVKKIDLAVPTDPVLRREDS